MNITILLKLYGLPDSCDSFSSVCNPKLLMDGLALMAFTVSLWMLILVLVASTQSVIQSVGLPCASFDVFRFRLVTPNLILISVIVIVKVFKLLVNVTLLSRINGGCYGKT